jgi:pyruvate dehydrogenase E1 component alpha subunit
MAKKEIELNDRIYHLSILDADGNLEEKLEPDIDEDLLKKLHYFMLLSRRFDERMLSLQRQGRIGTFGPIKGQEAAQLGAVAALEDKDWFVPSFREMGAEIWRGRELVNVLLSYGGFNEGGAMPQDSTNLPVAIPVASQVPHAVGIGYAIKYREQDRVAMVFFGDGATSEGDFHEALNFAGVFQTPTVFICQNNQWAISVPRSKQTRSETLAQKALAYGVPGIQVDGNDILAVHAAAREAVDRARKGDGPTLIECLTYRMSVHTTADDPKRYREDKEVAKWEKRDPLKRFQKYLKEKNFLSDEKIEELEEEIKKEIQTQVKEYEKKIKEFGDPLDMFDNLFEELPAYTREQKEEFRTHLEELEDKRDSGQETKENGKNDDGSGA